MSHAGLPDLAALAGARAQERLVHPRREQKHVACGLA
jgi:hypothetical protein